jgi:hypothetical protein
MAIIKIRNAAIDLDAAEIPNIDASKITTGSLGADRIPSLAASKIGSGTFADARIAASNVSQHATSFDDNKIVNDISTLAIRQASNENKGAYNTNSMFVDVFQDDTGIASHTTSARNSSEYVSSVIQSEAYETGDRTSIYTITTNGLSSRTGAISNWIDGSTSADSNGSWYWNTNGANNNDATITFDLGSGNSKIYTGAKIKQDNTNSSGGWKFRGSNDGSSFTSISPQFTWYGEQGSANNYYIEVSFNTGSGVNTTAYRYLRLQGEVGATSTGSPYQQEIEFKTQSLTTNATGNFISNAITAPSSVSSMGAIVTYQDNAGTNTLNTDIVLQLSADNGSNFTTATLTAMPDFASGIKMAKVNDLSVTAGTQLKYKISFANQASGSKEARIRGVSLQY